jgi:hypothetical protein
MKRREFLAAFGAVAVGATMAMPEKHNPLYARGRKIIESGKWGPPFNVDGRWKIVGQELNLNTMTVRLHTNSPNGYVDISLEAAAEAGIFDRGIYAGC